jgi:alcohol dehydrogenase
MVPFDFQLRTRTIFGHRTAERVGALARDLGFKSTLLVADPGIVAAGHAAAVERALHSASLTVFRYSDFGENPDSDMVAAAARAAAAHHVDSIVALGGGSSLDCAKGIGFLLANGGRM